MSMRKAVLLSAALIMLAAGFKSNTVFAQEAYDLEIIAETGKRLGRNAPAELAPAPSINDAGKVAFVARNTAGTQANGRVMLLNNGVIEEDCPVGALASASDAVQVNNSDQVIFRMYSNDGLFSDVVRIDNNCGGPIIGRGSVSSSFPQPFNVVLPSPTLNAAGRGVFSADIGSNTMLGSRADGTGSYNVSPSLTGFPNLFPMLADNNTTVVRWGGSATSPLLRFIDTTSTFNTANFIADSTNFNAIGEQPGMSDDGNVVAFVADHKTTGLGIYVSLFTGTSFTPIKAVGMGGIFSNFSLQARVGVNQSLVSLTTHYTLAYIAFGATGKLGLYTTMIDITNPSAIVVSEPSLVIEVDKSVAGLTGTVNNIKIYDPVNNYNEIAFWVNTTTGKQAIVRASPVRRVQWKSGQPIKDAIIEAYYLSGTNQTDAIVKPIPPADAGNLTKSNERGWFLLPPELSNYPLQSDEIPNRRGIRAKVTYTDKTMGPKTLPTGTTYMIINYPDWDPLRPFKRPTAGPLVIHFPNPVFFVPGMNGVINANYNDSDGKIRVFMNLQSGASPRELLTLANTYAVSDTNPNTWNVAEWNQKLTEWVNIKRSDNPKLRVPAFVMFSIPTFHDNNDGPDRKFRICMPGDSDGVTWGINACGAQFDDRIMLSANNIQTHFDQNIKSEMFQLTTNGFAEVPFDVMAHSLGGVISRHWLTVKEKTQSYPLVEHYVTFDAPHGGVKIANFFILRALNNFWSEATMNGFSGQTNARPDKNNPQDHLGWNYDNILEYSPKYLFFSAEGDGFIAPNGATGTALGRGRIMKPRTLFTFFQDLLFTNPNGYCERFVGGWGLQVFKNLAPQSSPYEVAATHSIQNEPIAFIPAARFLANGNTPALGTYANPGAITTAAADMSSPGGACQVENTTLAPSLVKVVLNATAGTQQNQTTYFDANTTLTVSAILSDPGATLVLLNSAGVPIPRFNEVAEDVEGGGKAVSFDVNVSSGTGTLRLSAGTVDTGAVAVIDYKNARYATASAFNLHNTRGSQVAINAVVVDTGNVPLVGNGGTGQVTVTKADGTDVVFPLFDDGLHGDGSTGDGIYGALLPGIETAEAARYSLAVNMMIDMGGGTFVHRTGEGMFFVDYDQATPLGVTAENAVDTDSNGLSDAVEIAMNINFTANGTFSLNADLMADGVKIDSLRNVFDVTGAPEVKTVSFKIPAKRIQETGAGALTLASIDLYENTHALYIGSILDYTTQNYTPANFDLPLAPFIAGCLPSFGRPEGGDEVIINGREFDNVTAVYFNTTPVASFQILNDSALLVTTPAWDGGSEKAIIRVVTPWNEGTRSTIFEYYAANRSPVLNPVTDKTVNEGQLLQFTVSASDPEANPLVLSARLGSGAALSTIGATFTDNGNGTGAFSWTPGYTQSGVYAIVFGASDRSLGDEQTITVTVNNAAALAPMVSVSADLASAMAGQPFQVTVGGSSAAGLASVWWFVEDVNNRAFHTIPGRVNGVVVNLAAAQQFGSCSGQNVCSYSQTVIVNNPGSYEIKANSRDILYPVAGEPHQASEGLGIPVVKVNVAPQIAPLSAQTILAGAPLSFSVIATDADGDTMALGSLTSPNGASLTANATQVQIDGTSLIEGEFRWTPQAGQTGVHAVQFKAVDGKGGETYSVPLEITVTENHRPVMDYVLIKANRQIIWQGHDEEDRINVLYAYRVDRGAWGRPTTKRSLLIRALRLPAGKHSIEVRSVDQQGFVSDPKKKRFSVR